MVDYMVNHVVDYVVDHVVDHTNRGIFCIWWTLTLRLLYVRCVELWCCEHSGAQ